MINNHSYWENKKVTSEEKAITKYLLKLDHAKNMNILHIGIGCSYLLLNLFKKYAYIYGITIAGLEKTKADQLQLPNNYNFLVDKYDIDNLSSILGKINYDIVVDINLKSFAPNNQSFLKMFELFSNYLNSGGVIITSKSGMNWTTNLEVNDGIISQVGSSTKNILKYEELSDLSHKYNLSIKSHIIKIGLIKRKTEEIYILEKK